MASLAARMSGPTAFLGTLFIPWNGSLLTESGVAGRPELSVSYDSDTGVVRITQSDGAGGRLLIAEGHIDTDGLFRNGAGQVIGRAIPGGSAVIDPDTLPGYRSQPGATTGVRTEAQTAAETSGEPKLCPDPTFENIAGRSERSIAYQAQITGLPPGVEIVFNGERYDGCRDSDGHLLEAKGEGYARMLLDPQTWRDWFTGLVPLQQQMLDHSVYAGDRIVEYYFAEETVANYFRSYAQENFKNVRVFYVPAMRQR